MALKVWLAKQIVSAAFLAYKYLLADASGFVYDKSLIWREWIRVELWWPAKRRSLETIDAFDDDKRADAVARFFKFENPPVDSGWKLENGKYVKIS